MVLVDFYDFDVWYNVCDIKDSVEEIASTYDRVNKRYNADAMLICEIANGIGYFTGEFKCDDLEFIGDTYKGDDIVKFMLVKESNMKDIRWKAFEKIANKCGIV
jgi:hypothetical protein